jgi:inosine/xanthosine triphosphatase
MKILVGSVNPVKVDSVKEAFSNYFFDIEVIGIDVESGVPVQPIGDDTFIGARNRANNLLKINNEKNLCADLFVGIEGGIANQFNKWFAFGCMCVIDKHGNEGFGTSPHFELPNLVTEQLLNGVELGVVMDNIQNEENTKQKQGAIGYFTKGAMNRKELYVEGLKVAVIPLLHKNLFYKK